MRTPCGPRNCQLYLAVWWEGRLGYRMPSKDSDWACKLLNIRWLQQSLSGPGLYNRRLNVRQWILCTMVNSETPQNVRDAVPVDRSSFQEEFKYLKRKRNYQLGIYPVCPFMHACGILVYGKHPQFRSFRNFCSAIGNSKSLATLCLLHQNFIPGGDILGYKFGNHVRGRRSISSQPPRRKGWVEVWTNSLERAFFEEYIWLFEHGWSSSGCHCTCNHWEQCNNEASCCSHAGAIGNSKYTTYTTSK